MQHRKHWHWHWRLGLLASLLWMGCGTPPSRGPGVVGQPPVGVPEPGTPRTQPPPTQPPTQPTQPTPAARPDDKPDDPALFDNGSGTWIGEACTVDADCAFSSGFCRKEADGFPQGYCSRKCSKYCPDRAGKTFTFCSDVAAQGGHCWIRCDRTKYPSTGCRTGYACKWSSRTNDASTNKEICVPDVTTPPPPPPPRDPPPRDPPPPPPPPRDPPPRDPPPPPPPLSSWIGEACNQDADCTFAGGYCLKSAAGYTDGHCTQVCTSTCPDQAGKPVTFCVSDGAGGGQCVSQCGSTSCRSGYTCENRSRYNQSSVTRQVCVPPGSTTPPPPRPPSQDKGTLVAKMYITYYYLSNEANYSGSANTTLYDSSCKAIATVPSGFSDSACIEGSGRLKDGRVVNYAKTCSCGRRCPTGGIICYSVLDKSKYPWGAGAQSRPLKPLRSLAVDRNVIAIGTKLYVEEWDGVQIPSVDGIGGFTHDGCVTADDVGGAIKGNHFDFFSGTSGMWKALEKIHSTKKYLTVYRNPGRCP